MGLRNNIAYSSIIDHFSTSANLYDAITEAGVIHSGENLSNHLAIFLKVNIGELDLGVEVPLKSKKLCWDKATEDAKASYVSTLKKSLIELSAPNCLSCVNFQCQNHTREIEEYSINIFEALDNACKQCLPYVCNKGGQPADGTIPGWSEYIKPFADENKFWSSVWRSQGKPRTGPTYELMKKSKNQYSYAVRRLKRCKDIIQNNKFLEAISNGSSNIYEEIRKYRGNQVSFSSRIDNHVGSSSISEHFADLYSQLYNRVDYGNKLDKIRKKINEGINDNCFQQVERVNEQFVLDALKKMKRNKHDAVLNIVSDCLIDGPPELVQHLTCLFRLFLIHGFVPRFVLLCSLIPLLKDKFGDNANIDNY